MIDYRSKLIPIVGLAIVLVLAFLATPALVKDADKPDTKMNSSQTKKANSVSKDQKESLAASKVGGEPDGGTRPVTPAEEKKLNAEIKKTLSHYQQHQVKQKADGSLSLVVAPFSLSTAVAHVTKDGKLEIDCSQNAQTSGQKVQQTKKNNAPKLPEE